MASIRQYKKKIKSAKNIAKITKAMQMVAASKMKRAQNQAESGREYASSLITLARLLSGHLSSSFHPLLSEPEVKGKKIIIFIAPQKGLCGSLLANLSRKLIHILEGVGDEVEFIAVGKKARDILLRTKKNILAEFDMGLSKPSYDLVPLISKLITDKYLSGEVKSVSVYFSEFINTMTQEPVIKDLLPLKIDVELNNPDPKLAVVTEYLFEPSPEAIIEGLLERYLEVEIFQFLLEAYASEQSARMVAMKNAFDNAQGLISDLTLDYNKARQASITSELIDISSAGMVV